MASLDRLEALAPKIVGVAHQGYLAGDEVQAAFSESRRLAAALQDRISRDPRSSDEIADEIFREVYRDELTMYTEENIRNCARLLVKRARDV
jgi:hypothetical protein